MNKLGIMSLAGALLISAPAALAGTWMTYHVDNEWEVSDGKHRDYQIDMASIATHKGWVYAKHRICLDIRDCRDGWTVSAHCSSKKLRDGMGRATHLLLNNDEWWFESDES